MRDHDEPRVLAQPLLDDGADRRALQAEQLRDLGEHAGPIGDLEVEVEPRLDVGDDLEARRRRRRRGRRDHRADDVAEHRARRLRPAGARPAQRDLGDRLRLDRHGVERAVDRRERVAAVEERRVDADADAAVDALGGADELQPEAQLLRVGHVLAGDVLDPLVAHVVEVHRRVEREAREDRHLRRGVGAVDVLGRVGLGVAEPLGLGERVVVGGAGLGHAREDEVRRAVDDAVQAVDVGGGERLLQDPDDRHDAGDGRLEAQLHPVLARARPQLLAVAAQQLLVRRDDVPARPPSRAGRSRGSGRGRP